MRRSKKTAIGAAVLAALGVLSCEEQQQQDTTAPKQPEDLTIVVEADKSRILQEEKDLKEKRQGFEEERERLAQQKSDIDSKLSSLSKKDKKQREELETEQRRLAAEEQRIKQSAESFEAERNKLQADKSKLLERLTKMTATRGGLTLEQREQVVAEREHAVAEREAQLAKREHTLAERDAEIGSRLQDISQKLAEVGQGGLTKTVVVTSPATTTGGSSGPTRSSINKLERQVRVRMDSKGLLADDLPPTAKDLEKSAKKAVDAKDYDSAQDALTDLLKIIEGINVNSAFVKAKMARINRLYGQKKPSAKSQRQIASLIAEVSEATTDGRFDRANRKINQISALLNK